jgi:hypothetical protein
MRLTERSHAPLRPLACIAERVSVSSNFEKLTLSATISFAALVFMGASFFAAISTAAAADEPTPFLDAGPDGASQVLLKHPFPKLKKHGKEKVLDVDFAHLACFDFTPPEDPALQRTGERKRIPWEVVALDGQLVRIRGYMMPTRQTEEGRALECVIVRNTMVCCYGQTPASNEWVLVKVREPGAVVLENVPLYFYGRLHVGEIYENGAFAGLYRLECDRVTMGE